MNELATNSIEILDMIMGSQYWYIFAALVFVSIISMAVGIDVALYGWSRIPEVEEEPPTVRRSIFSDPLPLPETYAEIAWDRNARNAEDL